MNVIDLPFISIDMAVITSGYHCVYRTEDKAVYALPQRMGGTLIKKDSEKIKLSMVQFMDGFENELLLKDICEGPGITLRGNMPEEGLLKLVVEYIQTVDESKKYNFKDHDEIQRKMTQRFPDLLF